MPPEDVPAAHPTPEAVNSAVAAVARHVADPDIGSTSRGHMVGGPYADAVLDPAEKLIVDLEQRYGPKLIAAVFSYLKSRIPY